MKRFYLTITMIVVALIISACSNQSSPTIGKVYQFKDTEITLKEAPKRVVLLSASLINIYHAVGGTPVARPTTNDRLDPELESLPEIGHVSNINIESLLGQRPDLVIGLQTQNKKISSLLDANKIPYLLINYDGIEDNIPLIHFFGNLTNSPEKADALIKSYKQKIATVQKRLQSSNKPSVVVLRATGKSITAETDYAITASMVKKLEIENKALIHIPTNITTKTVPYSLEVLVADNPDIILIVTMGDEKAINASMKKEMLDNPAWNQLTAVQNNQVYYLPSHHYLRNPGIETPEAMDKLVDIIISKNN